MIDVGAAVPAAQVWAAPGESLDVRDLTDAGPFLLFFYLFDWSST